MKVFEFLNTDRHEVPVFIFNELLIEKRDLCETHDLNGKLVGCTSAGCWSPDNEYAGFMEGDRITHTECEAFTFWNGQRYASIIFSTEHGEPDCHEVEEPRASQILAAWQEAKRVKSCGGCREYVGGGYLFITTCFESDPYVALVVEDYKEAE